MLKDLLKLSKKGPIFLLFLYNLTGLTFVIGPVMIPFLTQTAHITTKQAMRLTSLYLITTTIAEIPTGVIADRYGKKISLILCELFFFLGGIIFAFTQNLSFFFIAEILWGTARAFYSGAYEAFEYDTVESIGLKDDYLKISGYSTTFGLIGMLLSNVLNFILLKLGASLKLLMIISSLGFLLTIPLFLIIKERKDAKKQEFIPNYLEIIKTSLINMKKDKLLQKIAIWTLFAQIISYSGFFFTQPILTDIKAPLLWFGIFETVMQTIRILWVNIIPKMYKRFKFLKAFNIIITTLSTILITSIIFFYKGYIQLTTISLVIFFALLVDMHNLGNQILQDRIKSNVRSTTLSFISLIRTLVISALSMLFSYISPNALIFFSTIFFLSIIILVAVSLNLKEV